MFTTHTIAHALVYVRACVCVGVLSVLGRESKREREKECVHIVGAHKNSNRTIEHIILRVNAQCLTRE